MDVGCYAVHMARTLADAEPAVLQRQGKAMVAWKSTGAWKPTCSFPTGVTAHIDCSLFTRTLLQSASQCLRASRRHACDQPDAAPLLPPDCPATHGRERRWERVPGDSTYSHQLRAFAEAVRTGVPPVTDAHDGVANMRVHRRHLHGGGLPLTGPDSGTAARNRR